MQKNKRIRDALSKHGLYVYQLQDILSVSETTITRMMRHELPKDEQIRIVKLIEESEVKNGN